MKLPINTFLKDSVSGEYIKDCILCGRDVLTTGEPYLIEKAVKRFPELEVEEVLFEYCMCRDCHQQSWEELSQSSRQNIEAYFGEKQAAIVQGLSDNLSKHDLNALFDTCLISKQPRKNLREYQLVVHCQGTEVLPEEGVFMLSGPVIEEISELLSAKTRDHLDDFLDNNFGLPPELRDKLKDSPILVF